MDSEYLIPPAERIHYPEAMIITGRSRGYLRKLVGEGKLTWIQTGPSHNSRLTWLSRLECENLALKEYRKHDVVAKYWYTMTEAANALGIARQNAHKARIAGRLPAMQAGNGTWLVRRKDVEALLILERFRGPKSKNGG